MIEPFIIGTFYGLITAGIIIFFLFFVPKWKAKRELQKYWESSKEDFVYDGGFMFDYLFKSSQYKIHVRENKESAPFTEPDKGKIMITRYDGKTFFLDYLEVPFHIQQYWKSLIKE
jgi:hypothetical protein